MLSRFSNLLGRRRVPRLARRQQRQWEKLGKEAPYWSVLSGCDKTATIKEVDRNEFYRSGRDEILLMRDLFASVRHSVPTGRCLDWGCGLGRVLIHLAEIFDEAVGVDISARHLAITREYTHRNLPTVARRIVLFHAHDDRQAILKLAGRVDLVHSILVLQHMPPPLMIETLNTFAVLLGRGRYAFFQIATGASGYDFETYDLDHGGDFDMHALPPTRVREIFEAQGCRQLAMIERNRTGPGFDSHYFIFRKD
jgi:SAM-dependent methyltransferase